LNKENNMTIFLNGQYMPIEEAKISVLDRGFIFGDGVYEVIPVYARRPFRIDEHQRRLQYSLDGIVANPHSNAEWPRSSTNCRAQCRRRSPVPAYHARCSQAIMPSPTLGRPDGVR
jgi:branched-subunit amino acid aminotransferase/4-amino-4-deoxychorismate lyase